MQVSTQKFSFLCINPNNNSKYNTVTHINRAGKVSFGPSFEFQSLKCDLTTVSTRKESEKLRRCQVRSKYCTKV